MTDKSKGKRPRAERVGSAADAAINDRLERGRHGLDMANIDDDATEGLLVAARAVVAAWEHGDLAAAVRDLDAALNGPAPDLGDVILAAINEAVPDGVIDDLGSLVDAIADRIARFPLRATVEVLGGVATVTHEPPGVVVEIIDQDDLNDALEEPAGKAVQP